MSERSWKESTKDMQEHPNEQRDEGEKRINERKEREKKKGCGKKGVK